MVRVVNVSLLLLLACTVLCEGSLWDLAGSLLRVAMHSTNDADRNEQTGENYQKQDVFDRMLRVLNNSDDVISLEVPDSYPIGWSDVFDVGSKFSQFVMDSVDGGALDGVLPDLTQYGIDLQHVRDRMNTGSWDEFTKYLLDSADEDAVEDTYSNELDGITDAIHSFKSFEESEKANADIPPECFMTVPQMIRFAGYPCAVYSTTTKDGYKLTMHRIPFGSKWAEKEGGRLGSFEDNGHKKAKGRRTRRGRAKRPVVFLQHGILSDSSCWVSNGPKRSLAFVLADAGFDVWMGNIRGNTYSREHSEFDPDRDEKYWRFSWQQMSEFDLPAMIDAVLRVTGQHNLYYVGHSQGTLIAFARLAEDPSFNDKIRMMISLAPVATLEHIRSPVKWLSGLTDIAQIGISVFGGAEILPNSAISKWLSNKLHKLSKDDPLVYHGHNLLLFLAGFNVEHYHKDRLPVFLAQSPSGTSLHNLIHMSQLVTSGRTQKWDYGSSDLNLKHYGNSEPIQYDVSKITTPIAIFLGSKDDLADPKDGRKLASNLRSMIHFRMIRGWDHLDFLWGKDAPNLLYPDIVGYIKAMEEEPKDASSRNNDIGFRHIRGVDDEL